MEKAGRETDALVILINGTLKLEEDFSYVEMTSFETCSGRFFLFRLPSLYG